jgi:site-specific DNA-methyltransferase (adenine-specific)
MIDIATIKIGQRHRRDMGDIEGLAASIADVGLLHPVVVTPNGRLIAGERRIQAFRKLGRKQIPATVVDLDRIVRGEYAENFFRKAFAPSEIVAITEALEPVERAKAKEKQRDAGRVNGRGQVTGSSRKLSRAPTALDHVAKVVGKDRKTITKAKAVVEAAKAAPELFGSIKQEMDRTGRVDRAHKQLQTVQKRAEFDAVLERGVAIPSSQTIICADCLDYLTDEVATAAVDVVVTSPPYNIGIDYRSHDDSMERGEYLAWLGAVFEQVRRVLKPGGSFFLNVASTSTEPWLEADLAYGALRGMFRLQNHIIWVKAIAIEDRMFGHYKPINSDRFLNQNYESVFHLTGSGEVTVDRLAIGVPFEDKSNIERRGHVVDLHCAGDTWFIPYETVQSKSDKFHHPAGFPVGLPERCIKLHGLRDGLVVLDPFAGSGSTLVAAHRLGCVGIGIEKDEHYAKTARLRLAELTDGH